jgi:hypothetical protein
MFIKLSFELDSFNKKQYSNSSLSKKAFGQIVYFDRKYYALAYKSLD